MFCVSAFDILLTMGNMAKYGIAVEINPIYKFLFILHPLLLLPFWAATWMTSFYLWHRTSEKMKKIIVMIYIPFMGVNDFHHAVMWI